MEEMAYMNMGTILPILIKKEFSVERKAKSMYLKWVNCHVDKSIKLVLKIEYLEGVWNAFIKGIKIFGDNAEMLETILVELEYLIEIDEKANILMIESACST